MGKRKAYDYDDEPDWLPTLGGTSQHANHSYPAPGLPPPKAPAKKRQRKAKDPDAPAPEKRLAMMKKKCPQNILERLERVTTQRRVASRFHVPRELSVLHVRFFMVDRKRDGGELREEFQVLGSTGNVSKLRL